MKTLIKILFVSLLTILLFSCQGKKAENTGDVIGGVVHLADAWGATGNIMLSEVGDAIEYVALELSDDPESVLPSANQVSVRMASDYFLLYTRESAVKKFDADGKFVCKIGGLGKGPGEYIGVGTVLFTEKEDQILVFDWSQHKIIYYTKDGVFLKEIPVDSKIGQIAIGEKNRLYALWLEYDRSLMDSCKVFKLDEGGQVLDQYSLYQGRRQGPGSSWRLYSRFRYSNGAIEHFEPPYDTLWRYEDGAWKALWVLDPGSNPMPFEAYSENRFNDMFHTYSFVSSLLETKQHFFLNGINQQKMKKLVVDKSTSTVKPCDFEAEDLERSWQFQGLINDIDGGIPFWPRTSYNDEYFITLVDPTSFMEFEPAMTDPTDAMKPHREKLNILLENLNPEGNPVVMMVRMK